MRFADELDRILASRDVVHRIFGRCNAQTAEELRLLFFFCDR